MIGRVVAGNNRGGNRIPALVVPALIMPALIMPALLAGCATTKEPAEPWHGTGDVRFRALPADAPDSYPEADGIAYMGAYGYPGNAAPEYPAELLSQPQSPVTLVARVVVGERGTVDAVVPVTPVLDEEAPYFASIETALKSWLYMPLISVERRAGGKTSLETHDGVMEFSGKAVALPFRLDYEFTFSQRDGQGVVTTGPKGPPPGDAPRAAGDPEK